MKYVDLRTANYKKAKYLLIMMLKYPNDRNFYDLATSIVLKEYNINSLIVLYFL